MLVARTDSGRLSKVCLHVRGLGRRAVDDKRERDHVNSPSAEQVGRDGVRGGRDETQKVGRIDKFRCRPDDDDGAVNY